MGIFLPDYFLLSRIRTYIYLNCEQKIMQNAVKIMLRGIVGYRTIPCYFLGTVQLSIFI